MSENSREAIVAAIVSAKQIYLGGVSRIVDGFEKIDPTLSLESMRTIRRTLHEQRARTKLGVLALEDSYAVPAPDLINGEVATLEDMVNDCRVVIRTLHSDLLLMYESVQDYSILPADLSSRTYFVEPLMVAEGFKLLKMNLKNTLLNVMPNNLATVRAMIFNISQLPQVESIQHSRSVFHSLNYIRSSTKEWILSNPSAMVMPARGLLYYPQIDPPWTIQRQLAADCTSISNIIQGDLRIIDTVIECSDSASLEALEHLFYEIVEVFAMILNNHALPRRRLISQQCSSLLSYLM